MALSDNREWWWNRTGVYYCTVVADLPSFDAGQTFNPGDLAVNIAPVIGQPWAWVCLVGGTSPTWSAVGMVGGNTVRISNTPATITTADRTVNITAAGAATIPAATNWPSGGQLSLIDSSGGNVTVTPVAGTINGAAALTMTTNTAVSLVATGTNNWASGV